MYVQVAGEQGEKQRKYLYIFSVMWILITNLKWVIVPWVRGKKESFWR